MGKRIVTLLAAVVLGLAGCTDDETVPGARETQAGLPSDGPCRFLTAEEVERVTGESVTNVSRSSSHSTRAKILCVYETTGEFASVVVYSKADGLAEFERIASDELNTEPIELGDRAVIHGKSSVSVLQDGAFLGIGSQHLYEGSDSLLVELARIALERL